MKRLKVDTSSVEQIGNANGEVWRRVRVFGKWTRYMRRVK